MKNLNRRRFVQVSAAAGAAGLMGGIPALSLPVSSADEAADENVQTTVVIGGDHDAGQGPGEPKVNVNKYYLGNRPPLQRSAYVRLPYGAVRPSGWLGKQIQLQIDGLTGHFHLFVDYDKLKPDTLEGATRGRWEWSDVSLGWVAQNGALMAEARSLLDKRLSGGPHPRLELPPYLREVDGSVGDDCTTIDTVMLLPRYYELAEDKRVFDYFASYFAPLLAGGKGYADPCDRFNREDGGTADKQASNLVGLYWLYNRTGEDRFLATAGYYDRLVETIRRYFTEFPLVKPGPTAEHYTDFSDWTKNQTWPRGTSVDWFYTTHGVEIAWALHALAVYYQQRPEERYRTAVFKGIENLDKYYGQVGGRYVAHEHLSVLERGHKPVGGTEHCTIIEYMEDMFWLFEIFGDTSLADRAEVLAFNSLPGSTTPDLWCHQYDTQANQISCTVADRGFDNLMDANTYGYSPNFACCLYKTHWAWPDYISNTWMATHDNGLVAVAYGPSEVTAKVADGSEVTITEETDYPFDGAIVFRMKLAEPKVFPLKFRIPAWANQAVIRYKHESWKAKGGEVIALQRPWKTGDELTLELPMELRTERRYNNSVSVLRGPLYFALRVGQQYQGGGIPRNVVITPTTPWNYGLVLKGGDSMGDCKLLKNPIGAFPFAQRGEPVLVKEADADSLPLEKKWREINYEGDAPIVIKVRGRLLPDWGNDKEYAANAADPPPSPVSFAGPDVAIELIPYGCTRLRISEFPVVTGPTDRDKG